MESRRATRRRSSGSWRSAAPISRRGRARRAPSSGSPSRSSRRRERCPAARRRGRGWPRSCSRASTCSCSTSRRTTSTSTGSTGSSASSTGSRAASRSSRTTASSSTGRSRGSPRSTPGPAASRSTPAAGASSRRRASWPGSGSTRRTPTPQERRREVEALLHARRNQARAGGMFLAHATGGSDRRGTQALSGKVRQAERSLERIEHVEKPYEPWQLQLSLAAAQRPATASPRSQAPSASAATFRLGPVDLDLAPGERVAVTGRNGSGKTTLLALLLGELPLAAGETRGRHARRSSAPSTSAATAYDGDESLIGTFAPRAGLPPEEARTLLAKFNLGPEHVAPAVRDALAGRADAGAACRADGAAGQLPRPRRADEPPRPGGDRGARDGAAGVRRDGRRRLPRPALPGGRRADQVDRALAILRSRSWQSPRRKHRRPVATSAARSTASTRRA